MVTFNGLPVPPRSSAAQIGAPDIRVTVGDADPTGTVSSAKAFASAAAKLSSGSTLVIPPGDYLVDATTDITGLHVYGPGATIRSTGPTIFDAVGTFEDPIDVSALTPTVPTNAERTWRTTATMNTTGVTWEPGDIIKIVADDVIPEARAESGGLASRVGQFMIVESVDGSGVVFHGHLRDSYTTNVRASRMLPLTASITGVTLDYTDEAITTETYDGALWRFMSLVNPRLTDVNVLRGLSAVGQVISCYKYRIDGYNVAKTYDDAAESRFGYAIYDACSYAGEINGTGAQRIRHLFTDDTPRIIVDSLHIELYGRTYGTKIHHVTVESSNSTGLDTHSCSEEITFDSCTVINAPTGFGLRGKNHRVMNCTTIDCWRDVEAFDEANGTLTHGHLVDGLETWGTGHRVISVLCKPSGHPLEDVRETRDVLTVRNLVAHNVPMASDSNDGYPVYVDNATVVFDSIYLKLNAAVTGGNPAVIRTRNSSIVRSKDVTIDLTAHASGGNMALMSSNSSFNSDVEIDRLRSIAGSSLLAAVTRSAVDKFLVKLRDVVTDYTPAALYTAALIAGSVIDYTGAVEQFFVDVFGRAAGSLNWSTFVNSTTSPLAFCRQSSNAQNDFVTYRLPRPLAAGTYAFDLLHRLNSGNGIYTIETSVDNTAWTAQTTIDGYAAAATASRTEVTSLTVPQGTRYIRLTMATKNASSANFRGEIAGLSGYRTAT